MTIYTIGHSNVAVEGFVDLLRLQLIQMLVDTRSQPHSRYAPQFNRKPLKTWLDYAGMPISISAISDVIDFRLRSTSRLAGSSMYPDIMYLLTTGFGIHCKHHLEFAPTAELLNQDDKTYDWPAYEARFNQVLADRRLESRDGCDGSTRSTAERILWL
jgi:hypothetical protein